MKPEKLSQQLRQGNDRFLSKRRAVVALSLVAATSMEVISLYQMGLIKHLPEPPLPVFNADKVDASAEAYQYLAMPDGMLGLGSYATTLALASMGGQDRSQQQPLIPVALAGKVILDALIAGKLTLDQLTKHKAFCFWCMLSAFASFVSIPLVLPEAWTAFRKLRKN